MLDTTNCRIAAVCFSFEVVSSMISVELAQKYTYKRRQMGRCGSLLCKMSPREVRTPRYSRNVRRLKLNR